MNRIAGIAKNAVLVEGEGLTGALGWLCFYTVPESIRVDRIDLAERFRKAEMDPALMPGPIRPVDAFRRATKEAEVGGIGGPGGTTVNFLVREVKSDGREVTRYLVREVRDERNVRLSHRNVAEMRFLRNASSLMCRTFEGCEDSEVERLLEKVRASYEELKVYYDGDHVRRMIATILYGTMSPTMLRPATYFIPAKYEKQLRSLRTLCEGLGCRFSVIPMYDGKDARSLVLAGFEEQVRAHTSRLMDLVRAANLNPEEVGEAELRRALEETRIVLNTVREYEEVLQTSLAYLQADAEVLMAGFDALLRAA
ncbi:MAG: DUF6744 family protein [Anaerolineae bacterium]